jgi:hypothetical protein
MAMNINSILENIRVFVFFLPQICIVLFVAIPLMRKTYLFSREYLRVTGREVPGWGFFTKARQDAIRNLNYSDPVLMQLALDLRRLKTIFYIFVIASPFLSFILMIVASEVIKRMQH